QGLSAARLLHDGRVELGLREESLVDQQRAEWRSVRQNRTASHSARTLGVSALRVVRCIRISLSVAAGTRRTAAWRLPDARRQGSRGIRSGVAQAGERAQVAAFVRRVELALRVV